MTLSTDDLDALLAFLAKQWMPMPVQRAYDALAAERQKRQDSEARLASLEQRLRAAAAEPRPVAPAPGEEEPPLREPEPKLP
jgi:hypothetical protein